MLAGKEKVLKDTALPIFDGVQLTFANSVTSLGVILDPVLLFEKQINTAAKKALY